MEESDNSAVYENRARSRSDSQSSIRTDTTWRYSVFGRDRLGKGPILFTGPDGNSQQRVNVEDEHRFVGEGTMSSEGTSDIDYMWRPGSCTPHPRPKSACVGSIGWGIPFYSDYRLLRSGAQIRMGTFRQEVEDRHTHLGLSPWYPPSESTASSGANYERPRTALETSGASSNHNNHAHQRYGSGIRY